MDARAVSGAVESVLRTPGSRLEPSLQSDVEARTGVDLSGVRLHTGGEADRSATALDADAYTCGDHVVLGEGGTGRQTLVHELAHVVQQRTGSVSGTDLGHGLRVSDPGDPFEIQAAAFCGSPATSASPSARSGSGPAAGDGVRFVQRKKGKKKQAAVPKDDQAPAVAQGQVQAGFADVILETGMQAIARIGDPAAQLAAANELKGFHSDLRVNGLCKGWVDFYQENADDFLKLWKAATELFSQDAARGQWNVATLSQALRKSDPQDPLTVEQAMGSFLRVYERHADQEMPGGDQYSPVPDSLAAVKNQERGTSLSPEWQQIGPVHQRQIGMGQGVRDVVSQALDVYLKSGKSSRDEEFFIRIESDKHVAAIHLRAYTPSSCRLVVIETEKSGVNDEVSRAEDAVRILDRGFGHRGEEGDCIGGKTVTVTHSKRSKDS
jgi:hypothetical protein